MEPTQTNPNEQENTTPQQEPMATPEQPIAPMNDAPNPEAGSKSGGAGPIIGAIIVIALLIAGALYFFGPNGALPFDGTLGDGSALLPDTSISAEVDAQAAAASADLDALQADLDAAIQELDASL